MDEQATCHSGCQYFLEEKGRKCRLFTKLDNLYCAEHILLMVPPEQLSDKQKRINCPLDPSHSCFLYKLNKHLRICNARPKKIPYISEGINSVAYELSTENVTFRPLNTLASEDILAVISKIQLLYTERVANCITKFCNTNELITAEIESSECGQKMRKHMNQISAMIAILQRYNLLMSHLCYIEFGAGRGLLTYWIARILSKAACLDNTFLLIEKSSPKHKFDNKLIQDSNIERIRADISDLDLTKLSSLNKEKTVVGVSKHLCGDATDLALRCLSQLHDNDEVKISIGGYVMAFCCHHRCKWSVYTGRKFFLESGLNANDFYIMCALSSWAVSGFEMPHAKQHLPHDTHLANDVRGVLKQELSNEQKEQIGKQAKRILDYGRMEFAKDLGLNSALHEYVDSGVTLENVCMVAYR